MKNKYKIKFTNDKVKTVEADSFQISSGMVQFMRVSTDNLLEWEYSECFLAFNTRLVLGVEEVGAVVGDVPEGEYG